MSAKILIVKNSIHEGPYLIQHILERHDVSHQIVDVEKNEEFPMIKDFAALIVLGGPDSANDQTRKIISQLHRIQDALALRMPFLGVCLGLQTLVKAAGGMVKKNPVKEIGFRDPEGNRYQIELTTAGRSDPLLHGLEATFPVFQLHGETVEITAEMELLGTGKWCHNQIVKVAPDTYGIQFHFELTHDYLTTLIEKDSDLALQPKEQLYRDLDEIHQQYQHIGTTIIENFLKIAGLFTA